jgi:hypothetical protein
MKSFTNESNRNSGKESRRAGHPLPPAGTFAARTKHRGTLDYVFDFKS